MEFLARAGPKSAITVSFSNIPYLIAVGVAKA